MLIECNDFSAAEKKWLEEVFSCNFSFRDTLVEQINHAKVTREYTPYYLSIKFKVDRNTPPAELNVRVPIEMRVYKLGDVPTQFLLHVKDGYISELEILNADSSEIDPTLCIDNCRKEFVIDEHASGVFHR